MLKLENKWEKVCAKTYRNTLILSSRSIDVSLSKVNSEGMPVTTPKPRGRKGARTPSYLRRYNHMTNYIIAIPHMESHLCRATTMKKYFDCSILSVSQLYNYYKEDCTEKPQSHTTLRSYLKNERLSIFRRKSDLCNTCVAHDNNKKVIDQEYSIHQKN